MREAGGRKRNRYPFVGVGKVGPLSDCIFFFFRFVRFIWLWGGGFIFTSGNLNGLVWYIHGLELS